MKWAGPMLLLLAALVAPAYLALDARALVPVALRDRPWPLGLLALALALAAPWLWRRLWAPALVVALASPGALAWAAHARYRLPPSSLGAGVGSPLPDLTLRDEAGRPVRLRALGERPLLVVWFRGSWCPYCRRQLAELSAELTRFPDVRIVAVSADPPEPLAALKQELGLSFPLLSDPERRLVNVCELTHCVALLDSTGVVRWEVLSGNWEKDLPARALVQAAYRER